MTRYILRENRAHTNNNDSPSSSSSAPPPLPSAAHTPSSILPVEEDHRFFVSLLSFSFLFVVVLVPWILFGNSRRACSDAHARLEMAVFYLMSTFASFYML